MAFGLAQAASADFADIVKYDANAGRMFRCDYNPATREKTQVDITTPPPKFAIDFGSLEVGYGHFSANGPDFRLAPEGQQVPAQPLDKDDKGRFKYRAMFRVKLFGKVLGGLREWSSASNSALEAVEDLYSKFRAAPEATQGKIPIVELTKTLPVTFGKGQRQRTIYAPCFVIAGWTDRNADMGQRTVPAPQSSSPQKNDELNDVIPF
jgi:hypothetical protein